MKQINIHLNSKESYINTYNEKILSYDLSNYILEELKGISPKEKIEFLVSTEFNISQDAEEELVWMIRNNFGADITEIINMSKKQKFTNYVIFVISIILLLIYPLTDIEVVSEFVLIFAWVFLGEAICNFWYNGMENSYKIKRRKQIVNAKITFVE